MASLSLGKLSWQAQLGVFLALAVGMGAAFYFLVEEPRQVVLDGQRAELATIEERIARGREASRKLPEFRKEIGDLESRLESLKPILPEEKDVADLLRRIQTLATQSNLVIRGFKPRAISAHELHAEWPIGLELEGTYHNLGLFLDRVSKFPRIINVGGLQVRNLNQEGSAATIEVSCTATTFVLVDPPPAPPADAKKKKGAPARKQPAKTTE